MSVYITPSRRSSRADTGEPPAGFDAKALPILARHFFGVLPSEAARADILGDLRFQRQVRHLHRLGPRAVGELLAEIGAARDIRTLIDQRLAEYVALDPEIVRALGSDRFPALPIYEVRHG